MTLWRFVEQAKLLAISAHAVHAVLANRSAWCQLAVVDDVIAIIAATVARHSNGMVLQAGSLQGGPPSIDEMASICGGLGPVRVQYQALLTQHMLDNPEAATCFPQLCVALGTSSPTLLRVCMRHCLA